MRMKIWQSWVGREIWFLPSIWNFYFQSYARFNFKNIQPHSVFVTDRTLFDYASNGTKTWKDAHLGGYLQLPGSSIDYCRWPQCQRSFLNSIWQEGCKSAFFTCLLFSGWIRNKELTYFSVFVLIDSVVVFTKKHTSWQYLENYYYIGLYALYVYSYLNTHKYAYIDVARPYWTSPPRTFLG